MGEEGHRNLSLQEFFSVQLRFTGKESRPGGNKFTPRLTRRTYDALAHLSKPKPHGFFHVNLFLPRRAGSAQALPTSTRNSCLLFRCQFTPKRPDRNVGS